ncbi:hypothetical protein E4U60_007096 [Claviceps pazoutovae]|uniref:Uncharacterized protein n=1 Tax=Claviceps pazoutovae TaxID=1649127 RepID=A0A9P7SDU9_9HYPO|nr:hypothetical protein E4U60_007096 [Claviceps pazoutovae]
MATFPEDVRYFERYKLNRFATEIHNPVNPQNHAWWPNPQMKWRMSVYVMRRTDVESPGESERLSRNVHPPLICGASDRYLIPTLQLEDLEKHIPIDRETESHDAQLKRLRNAQSSKRSRTGLKTMREELDESQKARRLAEGQRLQERELRLQAEERARIL